MADQPADRRQRLQMLGAGVGRRQQQEDEIDRLPVDRLVIDRRRQPRDQRIDAVEPVELAVRDCDPTAEPGRAEPFALDDRRRRSSTGRATAAPPAICASWLQQLALVAAGKVDADRFEIEELGQAALRELSRTGGLRATSTWHAVSRAKRCLVTSPRFDPADRSVVSAIDHVEVAALRIAEHQRVGVAQVEHHHRVGHARFGNVDPGLGDDRRSRRDRLLARRPAPRKRCSRHPRRRRRRRRSPRRSRSRFM